MKSVFDKYKELYFSTKVREHKLSKDEQTAKAMRIQTALYRLMQNEDFKIFFNYVIVDNYLNTLWLHRAEPDAELKKQYGGMCSAYEFIIDMLDNIKPPQQPQKEGEENG